MEEHIPGASIEYGLHREKDDQSCWVILLVMFYSKLDG